MAKTIIVPLASPERDTETVSELSLPVARALAAQEDATIVLMSVIEIGVPMDATVGTVDEALVHERVAYLRQVARTMRGAPTQIIVRQDIDIAEQVRQVAAERRGPIVVMASHTRKGFRRTVMGSVAFDVVHTLHCPVVVVPATGERTHDGRVRIEKVLIPVDDSPASDANIAAVLAVLDKYSVAIHLLGVAIPQQIQASVDTDSEVQSRHDLITQRLDAFATRLMAAGHHVTWETRVSAPEEQIVQAVQDIDADMIAMTTRGRTGVKRVILGSIVESVLRDAGLPVILTRFNEAQASA